MSNSVMVWVVLGGVELGMLVALPGQSDGTYR